MRCGIGSCRKRRSGDWREGLVGMQYRLLWTPWTIWRMKRMSRKTSNVRDLLEKTKNLLWTEILCISRVGKQERLVDESLPMESAIYTGPFFFNGLNLHPPLLNHANHSTSIISVTTLSKMQCFDKKATGDTLLSRLGLRRVIRYRRLIKVSAILCDDQLSDSCVISEPSHPAPLFFPYGDRSAVNCINGQSVHFWWTSFR
ncbi:MAG: hypothetical protein FE78DRAFT_396990 [Acidomyces sp. 'richmondensis']|nr:MAG: hypothetical protein FE78DRAFT_396990 [Acidomyces sp. 'richmondensis']